jgi:hypothetical protein
MPLRQRILRLARTADEQYRARRNAQLGDKQGQPDMTDMREVSRKDPKLPFSPRIGQSVTITIKGSQRAAWTQYGG